MIFNLRSMHPITRQRGQSGIRCLECACAVNLLWRELGSKLEDDWKKEKEKKARPSVSLPPAHFPSLPPPSPPPPPPPGPQSAADILSCRNSHRQHALVVIVSGHWSCRVRGVNVSTAFMQRDSPKVFSSLSFDKLLPSFRLHRRHLAFVSSGSTGASNQDGCIDETVEDKC